MLSLMRTRALPAARRTTALSLLGCSVCCALTVSTLAHAQAPEHPRALGPLTAAIVGELAAESNYQAKAAEHAQQAAEARAAQQKSNYLPRVGLTARYTRLSDFTPPSVSGGGALVGTPLPAGTVNPSPTQAVSFSFPLVLDNYVTQATVAVPISDYFLRIGKAYSAATQSAEAARFDVLAARAKSAADGKIAFYTWLRARGAQRVAEQALTVAQAHMQDAENQFNVGNASKADVLRAQTQVASAELAVRRAKSGVTLAEAQVRLAIHAPESATLTPGESLDDEAAAANAASVPPHHDAESNAPGLAALIAEALRRRPELRSLERSAAAARKLAEVQRAGRYPVLAAVGEATYANPNPRRFPQLQEWFGTWAAGAQLTWSPNDVLSANQSGADAEARAEALEAQRLAARDGIQLEVTQAFEAVAEADAAVDSTARQLESAVEGYRVARELFTHGRATATTTIDAEVILAQTRFENLNARVDARVARIRLQHAAGRDLDHTSVHSTQPE